MAALASSFLSYNPESEDREALNIIKEKSRDLALKFSNVKVEFCDLDGLRWRRRNSQKKKASPTIADAAQEIVQDSTDFARKRDSASIQIRPSSIITPPLRSTPKSSTNSYFPPQRKSSLGKAAAGIKRSLSFKRKKDSQAQVEKPAPVTMLPMPKATVTANSKPDDACDTQPYTGGTALYRAGFSTFVSATDAYEDSDSDASSLGSPVDFDEDDMATPRPLSTVREASCDSYFDRPYDGLEEDESSPASPTSPIKIPTVPSIPALELDLSQALSESLDPEADIASLPPPTLPTGLFPVEDPNATIKPVSRPSSKRRVSPLPFSFKLSPALKSPPITGTTSLSNVSVQITFSPTLNNVATAKNEAHGFWSTSC
ncbi:hypothetical protein V5O48_017239, partial [Marasmius crinis-equi]